jgi:putative spermidine/putrescine transport system permease protein
MTAVVTDSRASSRKLRFGKTFPLLPAVVFLVIVFVVPVAQLLLLSFYDNDGNATFAHYERLFFSRTYFQVVLNTLGYAVWTTLFCLLGGYPIAYLIATISPRLRNPLLLWILVPLWTSFLVRVLAWMVILGAQGVVNQTLMSLGVISQPLKLIYNFFGVMIGSVHALMPIAILMMLSVMLNIDRTLVSAATTLGARKPMAFWRIYFPLSLPGVAASGLMVFVTALGFFIAPQLLGSPSNIMLAQVIIVQLEEALNWEFAAALSVVLLLATMLVLVIFDRVLGLSMLTGETRSPIGRRNGYLARTFGEVGHRLACGLGWASVFAEAAFDRLIPRSRGRRLDRERRPVLWIIGLAGVVFLALPTFFLIPISFSENRFLAWPPQGFTFQWYEAYFSSAIWIDATLRSLGLGLATAGLSMILGVPAAFVLARQSLVGKSVILSIMLLPMVLPHIIVAVGLFYLYANIGLVGTNLGLVLGNTIFSLPYVVVTIMAVLRNYDERLDHAAWTLGATPAVTFRRITLPLLKAGMVTAFLFAFVKAMDELAIALFVADAGTALLPKQLWLELSYKTDPSLAAVSTLILVIVGISIATVQILNNFSAMRGVANDE